MHQSFIKAVHNGYTAIGVYVESEGVYSGKVCCESIISFQAKSNEFKAVFQDVLEDYFEFCTELGETPSPPISVAEFLTLRPEGFRGLNE